MAERVAQFAAILLTALTLVPSAAHFFELPNKINLDRDAYFTVQGIYRGWAMFGWLLMATIVANLVLAIVMRRQRLSFRLALAGALLVAATLGVFFAWIDPANEATANWTVMPANWRDLRLGWEYGHAADAVLTFIAVCAVTLAALLGRER